MWSDSSIFYQIYPLGFCGAPKENDGITVPRIRKVIDWILHIKDTGFDAIYFAPVFASDRHGYDTRDYTTIDPRLGRNEDFADVCRALHDNHIRVVIDGVFNHVGRGFAQFRDVVEKRENSPYKDWFFIRFQENNGYNDGLSYEGWEGHYEMVKLNLRNPQVVDYVFACIAGWVKEFDIDGLRLDVAYCLDEEFLFRLRSFCNQIKPDFFLLGEVLFGDYNRLVNNGKLHSCTNYECAKGLYSSFNDQNMFEISYSLNRQFGPNHPLYKGMNLLSFADNHDLTRLASLLKEPRHLPLLYTMLFAMPGIPCVYYGSEWGVKGEKRPGSDDELRPNFAYPIQNELSILIRKLADIHKNTEALCQGSYRNIFVGNRQFSFERVSGSQRIIFTVNSDREAGVIRFGENMTQVKDLVSGKILALYSEWEAAPLEAHIFEVI